LDASELHVLLVDDDPYLLELMVEILGSLGVASVAMALSAVDGLSTYRHSVPKPNVVICDLCMPHLGGMEFLAALAKEGCDADILIVSGHNFTPPADPNWSLAKYDGPVLHLAEKLARLQGLRVCATFEKPVTREKVQQMLHSLRLPANTAKV